MPHTPGSWKADRTRHGATEWFVRGEDGNCLWDYGGFCDEPEARLIASAPDLLDALKECVTDPGAPAFDDDRDAAYRRLRAINEIARAAIAKATAGA